MEQINKETERGLKLVNNIVFSSIESAQRFFKHSRKYKDCVMVYDTEMVPGMVTAHVFKEEFFFVNNKED